MVSLGAIEEQLTPLFTEQTTFVVTAVSDEKKGKRVVLLIKAKLEKSQIDAQIKASTLPSTMQPSDIFIIEDIPLLGSGKVDFKGSCHLANTLIAENK